MSSRFGLLLGTVTAIAAALAFLTFDHPWALRGDNKLVLFPLTLDAYRQWMEGHIPFWSSGLWAGYPLLADCTAGALYLPHLLPFLLTPDPHLRAFDLSTALHLGILITGTVRLLEHLGSTRLTATFAALLTLMAPHVLGWTYFQPGICALSWWPWVMLCAQRLSETKRFSFGDATCGSACLALQVLAGYPELALYNGCFAAGWLLTNRKGIPLAGRLSRLLVLGLGALLLAAPQLIPTVLEIPDAIRGEGVAHLQRLSVEPESGAAVVDPRVAVDAFPLRSPFLGIASLLLATCALLLRAPRSVFLAVAAAVSALLALGDGTPLYGLLSKVPPFSLFRGPHKYFVISQLSVIWLAAGGLHQLLQAEARKRLAMVVGLGLALGSLAEYAVQFTPRFHRAALPHLKGETILPSGLDPFGRSAGLLTGTEAETNPPPRVHVAAHIRAFGGLGIIHGVESFRGGAVALLSKRHAYLNKVRLSKEHLDLFGVQLVYAPKHCGRYAGLEPIWRESTACVLRNPDWPARYTFLSRVRPVATVDEMLTLVAEDPAGPVPVLASVDEVEGDASLEASTAQVHPLSYRPGEVRLSVDTARERWLLIRESWKNGWRVQLDGRTVRTYLAAGLFFAFPVPAGSHEISLSYRTPGLGTGFTLATGWLIFVLAAIWYTRRGERKVALNGPVPSMSEP